MILRTPTPPVADLPILAVGLLRAAVPDGPWDNPAGLAGLEPALPPRPDRHRPHRNLDTVEQDVAWLLDRAATSLQTRGTSPPPDH